MKTQIIISGVILRQFKQLRPGLWHTELDCNITIKQTPASCKINIKPSKEDLPAESPEPARPNRQKALEKEVKDTTRRKGYVKHLAQKKESQGKYPELTEYIITVFGRRFLGKRNLQIPPTSARYNHFRKTSYKVAYLADKADIKRKNVVKYLFDALEQQYKNKGKFVSPSNLCSDFTWNILMPQYLKDIIPGIEL